jgi:uncharacterized membrane-anchored protein
MLAKVPAITLGFWIIKILATTLGETGGDALSMSANLGYLVSTGIFGVIFVALVYAQIKATKFNPWLYWATIIASTTVGTTMADFATRSMGIGYLGGSILLLSLLAISLFIWYRSTGSISVGSVSTPRSEVFYWLTITFSQTLGTALGDWFADSMKLGYNGAALVFSAALLVVLLLYFATNVSRTVLFWVAFVLTRPLGAVVGDFIDKPIDHGGLDFSRLGASALLIAAIVVLILVFKQRAAPVDSGH